MSTHQINKIAFVDRVCCTCGIPFVAAFTKFGEQTVRDFCIGRRTPRNRDMNKFIDALGKFNSLTMRGAA